MLQLALLACLHTPRLLTTNASVPQETLLIQLETVCPAPMVVKTVLQQLYVTAVFLLSSCKEQFAKLAVMMASHKLALLARPARLAASNALTISSATTAPITIICTMVIATKFVQQALSGKVHQETGFVFPAMNLVKPASIILPTALAALTEEVIFRLQLKPNLVCLLVLMVPLQVKESARYATLDVPPVLDQPQTVFPVLLVKFSIKEDAGLLALLFKCKPSVKMLHVLINVLTDSTGPHKLNVLHATLSVPLVQELLTTVLLVFMDQYRLMVLVQSHAVKTNSVSKVFALRARRAATDASSTLKTVFNALMAM